MSKKYKYYSIIKIGLLVLISIFLYGGYDYFNDGSMVMSIIMVILGFGLAGVAINMWFTELIINEEGIRFKNKFISDQFREWEEIKRLGATRGLYGLPIFILETGDSDRDLTLGGFKDTNQMLLDIYNHAPHIRIDQKVRSRIRKARK